MERSYCVYIITNKPNGILYVGVTSNLPRRMHEHQNKLLDGFSKKYGLSVLYITKSILDLKKLSRLKSG